jgi:hypothetical protein
MTTSPYCHVFPHASSKFDSTKCGPLSTSISQNGLAMGTFTLKGAKEVVDNA